MHPLDLALSHCIHGDPDASEAILRGLPQDDPRVRFNLGWHDLRHGRFQQGFAGLNAGRWISVFGSPPLGNGIPIWRDEDLHGKTLLFRCEGGFGDEICNVRFVEDFLCRGATVVIACHRSLFPLFRQLGCALVTNEAAAQVDADYWVPAMSAAALLGYDNRTMIGRPYLTAIPRLLPGDFRVGIRWSGNPRFEHEQHRRFDPQPLIDLHPLATFYSLQRDDDLRNVPFADLRDDMQTWADTAEIIAGLDLVITSCTSIAHLAGALGVQTWVIVPIMPYYTWALPGNRSPWYESVRLFRQTEYGDWTAPLAAIRQRLEALTETRLAA